MNGIDPKNSYFSQFSTSQTKTTLAKSMVTHFENKNTEMNLDLEANQDQKLKLKKRNNSKKDPYKEKNQKENDLDSEQDFQKIKRLMNII